MDGLASESRGMCLGSRSGGAGLEPGSTGCGSSLLSTGVGLAEGLGCGSVLEPEPMSLGPGSMGAGQEV